MSKGSNQSSHRRKNLLTGEWVLVSPHRMLRPWNGEIAAQSPEQRLEYDSDCYLCPGNTRAEGAKNPKYIGHLTFDNDFPALSREKISDDLEIPNREKPVHGDPQNSLQLSHSEANLFQAEEETGACRVICYSASHNQSLATLNQPELEQAFSLFQTEYQQLAGRADIGDVQLF